MGRKESRRIRRFFCVGEFLLRCRAELDFNHAERGAAGESRTPMGARPNSF